MKSVCFDQTSLQYLAANILPNAITFCESDEILAGLSNGQLILYRVRPTLEVICEYAAADLITAVAALQNSQTSDGSNIGFQFVCVTALGLVTFLKRSSSFGKDSFTEVCTLQTPPNPFSVMIGDIEKNGQLELVIGYTDRFARIYKTKFQTSQQTLTQSVSLELCCSISFSGHVASMCSFFSYSLNSNCLLVSQPDATFVAISFSELPKTGGLFEVDDKIRRGPGPSSLLCRTAVKTSWCRPFLQFTADSKKEELVCIATLDGLIAICRLNDGVSLFEIALASQLVDLSPVVVSVEKSLRCFIAVASWNGVIYLINDNLEIRKFETGVAPQCVTKACQSIAPNCLAMVSVAPSSLITYEITENSAFLNPPLFCHFEADPEFTELVNRAVTLNHVKSEVEACAFLRKLMYECDQSTDKFD